MSGPSLDRLAQALGFAAPAAEIVDTVRAVYAAVDAELTAAHAGLALPCGAGCDGCCHEAVFLSAPEFLVVAREVMGWPPAERRGLLERMRTIAARFEDELELLDALEAGPERDEVAARVKFSCPLLSEAGRCRVYGARELNARTFGGTLDEARGSGAEAAYGCEKTHARLAVLPQPRVRALPGARAARARLVAAVSNTETVQVYPWWFTRYAVYFEP